MEKGILYGILILLVILLLCLVVLLWKTYRGKKEKESWQQKLTQEMSALQNMMMQTLRQDINMLNENTGSKLLQMEEQVHKQLYTSMQSTSKAFQEMMQQMGKIDESQRQLHTLHEDIHTLHTILNDKKTRGIYGEIELYSLLESAYGTDSHFFAKQYKLSNGCIVDAVLFGNEALGMIPIDSKFPLENFMRLQEESLSSTRRSALMQEFKNDVKKHIQAIAHKYLLPGETGEFAYMFIPAEAIFSFIHANAMDVVQYSYEKKVYLVSPTTMMAYITAMKALYLEKQKSLKSKEIQKELHKLSIEFERFAVRYETVGKDFEKVYKDMKDLLITAHKLQKRFVQIEQVDLEEAGEKYEV